MALGQASGDFRETYARVVAFNIGSRWGNSSLLAADGFTQQNPCLVATAGTASTRLSWFNKVGILGGSVAFTRPDQGNGIVGGPALIDGDYSPRVKPLGIFINDAAGNPYENVPAKASGRAPYYNAGTYGVRLWETQVLFGVTAGDSLVYSPGDTLYASANGFLTNRVEDAYQYQVNSDPGDCMVMGTVTQIPDGTNPLLVFDTPY